MFQKLFAFLLGMALSPALSAYAQTPPVLKSVSVTLPDPGTLFPTGVNADAINNNCLACHSSDMVLNQPPLSKAAWEGVVHKMIATYKAPVDEADVPAIVDYLDRTKGVSGK
jgi:hypothetical protein